MEDENETITEIVSTGMPIGIPHTQLESPAALTSPLKSPLKSPLETQPPVVSPGKEDTPAVPGSVTCP